MFDPHSEPRGRARQSSIVAELARRGRTGRAPSNVAERLTQARPNGPSDRSIRSAALIGYAEAASAVGLSAEEMFAVAGLESACVANPDTKISLDAYLALLAASAAKARCGDFGARAAMMRGLPDYGLVSLAMRESETVGAALSVYTEHLWHHCDDIAIHLDDGFDDPFIRMSLPGDTLEEFAQVAQFCTVGVTTQLRWLTGNHFRPKLVCYSFPRPASALPPVRFFDCEIRYDQTVSGLLVGKDTLSRSLVTSDPRLRRIARLQLDSLLAETPDRFVGKVRETVKELMPEGRCSTETVAARFRIDRRTLNRRLKRTGDTFSSLVQKVRVETTLRALNSPCYSLADIADLVGFDTLSSFSRWFQGSFGCSARDWRRGIRPIARS